jgi:hypothetical protein
VELKVKSLTNGIVRVFYIVIKFIIGISAFILALLILQYLVNPKYNFPESHPFRGDYVYNPYRNVDSLKWNKANFHVHTRLYLGITGGALNTPLHLDSLYKYFGYNIFNISNYENISTFNINNKWYVPVYEHGFSYYKNHQLVLNGKKVSWLDYFFRQTLNNKQFIINTLKQDTSVVLTMVHPLFRKAYSHNDFKYLCNYDCLEIADHDYIFTSYYDTILSYGHPVFIMANDDSHDLANIYETVTCFNFINSDLLKDSILYALKTGRTIGIKLNLTSIKTNEEKRSAIMKLPGINSIFIRNDTIRVSLNKNVNTIKFIGQNGKEKESLNNCSEGSYLFRKTDTYIRIEIKCNDGTVYYLNPFFRYDGTRLTYYSATYDIRKTWTSRLMVLISLMMIFIILRRRKRRQGIS